jgi:polar amino acid transport system substrate-binding protein
MIRLSRWSAVLFSAISITLVACGGGGTSPSGTGGATDNFLNSLKQQGYMTIGTSNDPPMSFKLSGSDTPTGVVPEIIQAFAASQGIKQVKVVVMPFGDLIPALTSHRIDMIGDTMYPTDKRKKVISFTQDLFYNPEALIVRKGNPLRIHSLDDLNGRSAGSYEGTVWIDWLNAKKSGGANVTVKSYPTIDNVMADVAAGRLDAGVIDASIAGYALQQNPSLQFEIVADYQPRDKTGDAVALGVRQSDESLRIAFNQFYLPMLKGGTVVPILKKWGLQPSSFYLEPLDFLVQNTNNPAK